MNSVNVILDDVTEGLSFEQKEKLKSRFRVELGGSNIYISKTDGLKIVRRNMHIIAELPRYGEYCSKSQVHDLARKYNLSDSQIYRIRREAKKTYLKIEELFDFNLISAEQHCIYTEILKEKLPSYQLGKTL